MGKVRPALLILLSGVLTALSCPGFLSPFILLFSLVPAFIVYSNQRPAKSFFSGVFLGTFSSAIYMFWLVHTLTTVFNLSFITAVPVFVLVMFLYSGIVSGISAVFFSECFGNDWMPQKRNGLFARIFLFSAFFAILNSVMSLLFFGLSLNSTAACFYKYPFLIRATGISGEASLSFIIVMTNLSLFFLWKIIRNKKIKWPEMLPVTAITVLLWICIVLYGALYPAETKPPGESGSIMVVQASVDGRDKWKPELAEVTLNKYLAVTESGLTEKTREVFWPETAISFYLSIKDKKTRQLIRFCKNHNITIYSGAPEFRKNKGRKHYYNSIVKIDKEGFQYIYRKEQLIPFAEYCPSKVWAPIYQKTIGKREYSSGCNNFYGKRFGFAICFESLFPELMARRVADSKCIVVLSDDFWLGGSTAAKQHLAEIVVRAAETRQWIISSVNNGIPAVIRPDGSADRTMRYQEEGVMIF